MHSHAADELTAALACTDVPDPARREYQTRLRVAQTSAARRGRFGTGSGPPTDHYRLLGVARGCTVEEARKAYKKLALQLHPDKAATACKVADALGAAGSRLAEPTAATQARLGDAATWVFKCLGEAHDVLTDAAKRGELDDELAMWSGGGGGGGGLHGHGGHGGQGGFAHGGFYYPAQPQQRQQQYGRQYASQYGFAGSGRQGGWGSSHAYYQYP